MNRILTVLLVLSALACQSQDVPSEREPSAYWQQEVHYTIEAFLDEEADHLVGAATMAYQNNSGEDLNEVFFQLYLNAFRPNSRWAGAEARERYDFQGLEEPDYGYERLQSATYNGTELTAEYPYSPDSTVVRFALPEVIPSGGSATFALEWEARPSTLCRRQCREGRSYDFAQWYPRVATYDHAGWQGHPLYPQGEFYGEYGVFDVTLDVAADQVIGATGAVIEGDPGWVPLASSPSDEVRLQSDWYTDRKEAASPGLFDGGVGEGRKRVRFYGEKIHHFAWSTSPDYRYETGRHGDVAIHVLFRPDDDDWADGVVVERSVRALEFLESVFGPYPYPQITNLHRIEGGGTEFPMMVMDGGPSQGLILHEFAHQYAMGIFGSNEWKDAYLDEGLASFLGNWFVEETEGINPWQGTMERVGEAEATGVLTVPVATVSEDMPSFGVYGLLAYTKPSIIYRMLREYVGAQAMRNGLQLYYQRKAFQHVVEDDLRGAIEEASGMDLTDFFQQWFHTTATLDYSVTDVSQVQTEEGWTTTATIERSGDAWAPVMVQIGSEIVKLESHDAIQTVEVTTADQPTEVVIDPDFVVLDTDWTNNRYEIDS